MTADRLFALAELSFLYAERSGHTSQYLAAAAYAYAYLFPEADAMPGPLDPRVRLAGDFYNLGLVRGFARPSSVSGDQPRGDIVGLEGGKFNLPFGEMTLAVNPSEFLWGGYRFSNSSRSETWRCVVCATGIGRPGSERRWPPSSNR